VGALRVPPGRIQAAGRDALFGARSAVMKAKDLRERSTEDLMELKRSMQKDLFSYRMKNYTGQLDDTSLMKKTKKDVARIELILHERVLAAGSEAAHADGGKS